MDERDGERAPCDGRGDRPVPLYDCVLSLCAGRVLFDCGGVSPGPAMAGSALQAVTRGPAMAWVCWECKREAVLCLKTRDRLPNGLCIIAVFGDS
mgnify:CR=1 FL=1